MQTYPSLYRARAVAINGSTITAFVPSVFGDQSIRITDVLGDVSPGMGWVFFQAGNPEFPVWTSGLGGGNGNGGNGNGGTPAVDEVWIGPDEPLGPQELWYDTDEVLPAYSLIAIKGTLYGTATPLPAGPKSGDVWILGTPVPTSAPVKQDTGLVLEGDLITWNGTAWLNIGGLGPRGAKGDKGDKGDTGVPLRQVVESKGSVTTYTLLAADEDKLLLFTATPNITLTVPTNASVPLAAGFRTDIVQTGSGRITVSNAGITLIATPTAVLRAQGSSASLIKTATPDTWLLSGDMG